MPGRPAHKPRVYPPDQHPVRRTQLSPGARSVTRKLQEAGFKAFIVGGAVRDLMLGLTPKDFDIATDAHAGGCEAAVSPRLHHRPPLPPGARARRRRGARGVDVPRRADRRGRHRRARPPHLRQRLRLAGRRRAAPRLHDQRALFRPRDGVDLGLRRRRHRRPRAAPQADRTAGHALPRGSGADAARGAPRGQARHRDRAEDRRADPQARAADPERAAGTALRRNAEAAAVGPRRRHAEEPARARAAPWPAAAARRHPRAAARRPLHRCRARQHRHARARRPRRVARIPVRHAAVARGAGDVERRQGQWREAAARAVRGDGPRARRAGQAHRDPAALRGDDQGDLVVAAALRAARGLAAGAPCSSIRAFVPAYDFLAIRGESGEVPVALVDWWTRFQEADDAERAAMLKPDEAPKRKRPRSRGRRRKAADAPAAPGDDTPRA